MAVAGYGRFELPGTIPQGMRDDTLYHYALSLRSKEVPEEEAQRLVLDAARTRCVPPFPESEALKKVRSAYTKQPGHSKEFEESYRATYGHGPEATAPVNGDALGWDDMVQVGEPHLDGEPMGASVHHTEAPGPHSYDMHLPDPEALPEPPDVTPAEMLAECAGTLFRTGEPVSVVTESHDGHPAGKGRVYTREGLVAEAEEVLACVNPEAGAWVRFNPSNGPSDADVTAFRHVLVESDPEGAAGMSAEQLAEAKRRQFARVVALRLPCACVVDSGNKSVHAVVRVADPGEELSREEWKARGVFIYRVCDDNGLAVDHSCGNPSRLMRLAGARRGDETQTLLAVNCGMPSFSAWRAWVEGMTEPPEEPYYFPLLDFTEETGLKPEPLPYVVGGLLPREHIALMVSKGGAGKSYLALELALAVATGRSWLDFPCIRGRVCFVDPEVDEEEIKKQRWRWVTDAMGLTPEQVCHRVKFISLRGETEKMDKIDADLRRRYKTERFDLIVLDSINCLLNGDENSAVDVRRMYAWLQRLARDVHAALLVVHHTGKGVRASGEQARGSSVHLDAPDVIMELNQLRVEEGTGAWEMLKVLAESPNDRRFVWPEAFRMTFPKNRSGAPIKPIDITYRHPLHTVDHTGELAECNIVGSPQDSRSKGGRSKAERSAEEAGQLDSMLAQVIEDIHAEGDKATRVKCLDLFNARREEQGMGTWKKRTFENATRRHGRLSYRMDEEAGELRRATPEELAAEAS